jgi:hypothetical protein
VAQTVLTPDGKTATNVQRSGAVVDVTTGTVKGVNAFNSFKRFEVGQPDTVNLRLPDGTSTLINMVYDAPIRIDGVLNSIKGNQIGGRVVFADPFGMVVGRTGVLNVGSLIATSPTASFLSGVIGVNGIDDAAVGMLLSTKLAQAPGSSVRIDGRINALERVRLQAESVIIGSESIIRVGAAAAQSAAFQMAVNTQGLQQATGMVDKGGVIEIVGDSVSVAGQLDASGRLGGGTVRVGRVEDTLANSVDVATTAVIKADATESGDGGTIDIWGSTRNHFMGVASAQGGALGGDGGFVEVSAKTGLLYAGTTYTGAAAGKNGMLLIDPNVVCIVANVADACTTDAFLGTTSTVLVSSLQAGSGNIALEASDGLYVGSSDGTKSANLDLSSRLTAGTTLDLYGWDLVQINAGSQIKTGGGAVTLRTLGGVSNDIVVGAGAKVTTQGGAFSALATDISIGAGASIVTAGGNVKLDTVRWGGVANVVYGSSVGIGSGALISTATTGAANAGKIEIFARDNDVNGASFNTSAVTGKGGDITFSSETGGVPLTGSYLNLKGSTLTTQTGGATAGSVLITNADPTLENVTIKAGNTGSGVAGSVVVDTSVTLLSQASGTDILLKNVAIDAKSTSGQGGSLDLTARKIVLENTSFDGSGGGTLGGGGSIILDTSSAIASISDSKVTLTNSTLTAKATGTGGGGALEAGAREIVVTGSTIDVSSTGGIGGSITLDTTGTQMAATLGNTVSVTGNSTLKADGGSQGGTVLLAGREITLTDSEISANGTDGSVTLEAKGSTVINIFGVKSAESKITVTNSKISSDKVDISAETTIENKPFVPTAGMSDADFAAYMASYASVDNAVGAASQLTTEALSVLEFLTGVQIVLSKVDTKATVTIDGASQIHGDSEVNISAKTLAEAGNGEAYFDKIKGFLTPVQQTKFGLGVGYAGVKSDAIVNITGTTKLSGGDLNVLARNDVKVELEVETASTDGPGAATAKEQTLLAIAAGVVTTDVNANTTLGKNVVVNSAGHVSLAAVNFSEVSNSVTASTGADGKAGAAVAVTIQNTQANTQLNTNIVDASSATVLAIDHTASTSTESVAKVGATPFQRFSNNVEAYASEDFLATLSQRTKEKKAYKPRTEVVKLSGAVAYTDENHTAIAQVADGVTIHTRATSGDEGSGEVLIGARVDDTEITLDAQASAISSVSGGQQTGSSAKNAAAAGVAVGNYMHNAQALVGEGVTIVGERIGVLSHVDIPLKELPGADDFNKTSWDSFSKVKDNLGMFNDTLSLSFVNARGRAKGSGDEVGFSGSLTIMLVDNTSRAEVGANSKLLTNSDAAKNGDSYGKGKPYVLTEADATTDPDNPVEELAVTFFSPGAVSVQATTNSNFILQTGEALNTNEGKGVGLSNGFLFVNNHSDAVVREGVKIAKVVETADAADPGSRIYSFNAAAESRVIDSVIKAYNDTLAVNFTIGAGKATDASIAGMAVETFINNRANASVDNEATLKAESLKVEAADTPLVYTIAGTLNMSSQTTIGVGLGINDIQASTTASIADNDTYANANGSARVSKSALTGVLDVGSLGVLAHTGGAVYNIAVAGSVSSTDTTPGIGEKLSKLNQSFNKALCAANNLMGQGDLKCATVSPKKKMDRTGWAVTGAGAVAVNTIDLVTTATMDGINGAVTDLTVNATGDSDLVTVAGGAAFTLAKAGSKNKGNATFAGAVAVNVIGNKVESHLANVALTDMNSAEVSALKGGENLSIGLSMAVNTDTKDKKAIGFAGSASITLDLEEDVGGNTQSKNAARTYITGAQLDGLSTGDLNVVAYNSSLIGTGGGSMTTQGQKSVGATVTYAEIGNATEVFIDNSRLAGFDNVSILAHSASQIVAASASASVSVGQKDSTGINGSIVLTDIGNSTRAVVKNSRLDGGDTVSVTAREGTRQAAYEARIAQGAVTGDGVDDEGEANGYDYNGSKIFTDSAVAGGSNGSSILGIAGTVQISTDKTSKNIGASVAYNMISNTTEASVTGTYGGSLTSGSSALSVTADSSAYIRSFAVGASVAGDTSVGGSVSVNLIDNTISATATDVKARGVTVSASDSSNIDALAGQINVSTSSKGVAAGGALAYNEIGNTTTANVTGTSAGSVVITGGLNAATQVNATASNTARIRAMAAAGAVSTDSSGSAFSGSIGFNIIHNTQTAGLKNIALSGMSGSNDQLKAIATDSSTIQALSGAVSFAGKASFGGALSTNTITNDTDASIENVTGTSVETIVVQGLADGIIQSLAAGVAASTDKGAIAGSVAVNTITNDMDVAIKGATITGGTLSATGDDKSKISTISGAAAIAPGGNAIGVAASTNTITNTQGVAVENSNLTLSGASTVRASEQSAIDSIGASGGVGDKVTVVGAFVVNTIANDTTVDMTSSSIAANTSTVDASDSSAIRALGGAFALSLNQTAVGAAGVLNTIGNDVAVNLDRATLSGGSGALTVNASSTGKIQALAASAAFTGGQAAVGIAGSVNSIVNTTRIVGSGAQLSGTGLTVAARDKSTVQALNGAVSISLGTAAVGGAIGANTITNQATVDFDDKLVGPTLYTSTLSGGTGALTVAAENDKSIESIVAAAAGTSGNIAASGSVSNNFITNTTRAQVTDTAIRGASAAISATDSSDIDAFTGVVAVSVGSTAVGAAASSNVLLNTISAGASGGSLVLTGGPISVAASSTGTVDSLGAAGAVGADNAVSASAVGNNITNSTQARLNNVTGSSSGGSVTASDSSAIRSLSGSAAIAPGAVAVGGAASVNRIANTTEALIDGTSLAAGSGSVTHTASNSSSIKSLAAAAAGGGSVAAAASAATNFIDNKTHALMTSSTLSGGSLTQQSRDTSLIQSLSGAAAVSIGTVGVGFAASINTVTNENFSGATDSSLTFTGAVSNDTKSTENIDTIAVAMSAAGGAAVSPSASTNTVINKTRASYSTTSLSGNGVSIKATDNSAIRNLTGAAAIDFGGGAAVGGAGSINTVKNTTEALVTGGTWASGSGAMTLSATNSESIKAIAASAAVSANVGVAGSIVTGVVANVTRAQMSGATASGASLSVTASDTAGIDMVAGALGVGVGAAGVGAALNGVGITNTVEATLLNTGGNFGSGAAAVSASSTSTINSLAAAGAGSGGVSVGGSDTTNVIDNTTAALVSGSTLTAGSASITAADTSTINTLAGAAAISGTASVGAAMSINTMTNETSARLAGNSVVNAGSGGVNITGTSGETINTAAVAGAGSGGVAVAGSVAVNHIGNSTLAEIDDSSALAGTSGNIVLAASDTSGIKSASGSAAVGGGTSVGVAASANHIGNSVDARIRGGDKASGGYHNVTGSNVSVAATSKAKIESLAAGIAADATAGVAGSASINVIGTNTRAAIDRSADVLADGNALVTAASTDDIFSIAGSAGIGIAAAGVGVATGVAVVTGTTSATIGGNEFSGVATKVDGRGNGGTSTITTGELLAAQSMSLSNPTSAFVLGDLTTGTQNVRGVAVTALAKRHFANGAFSLGGGSVGVAGTFNANAVSATTDATIQNAEINQRGSANSNQQVNVIGASHTYGAGFAGAVGLGAYAGVGAAIEGSGYNVTTRARILNATTSAANNAMVKARATEGIATLDAGASAGLVGVQGTGNIGIFQGRTDAVVYGGTLTARDVTVKADHDANFGSAVGAVAGGAVGVAGSLGVLVNAHTTTARIGASTVAGDNETANTTVTSTGNVLVDAESQTSLSQYVVSGSAGGFAFAGAVGVIVLDDTALATVNKASVTAGSGSFTVDASVDTTVKQAGGAAALGFGGGGVGASLGLALMRGQADAWVANSNVTANTAAVQATNTQDLDALSAAGGFDLTAGMGGSFQLSLIGLGSSSTGSKADSEISGLSGSNGALTRTNNFAKDDRLGGQDTSNGSVDETNSSKTKFSTADRDRVNAANSYDFMARMNTPLANTTRARVTNSTIATTTSTSVTATSETALRNTVGAAGIGGAVGVAAAISVAKVSNQVTASVDSLSLLQGRSGSKPSITVNAVARDKSGNWTDVFTENRDAIVNRTGAAGGALGGAASASVAVSILDNTVTSNLDAAQLGGGAVSMSAADETNASADAVGAQVGGGAFGVAVAVANRQGSVTADFTPTGASSVSTVNINATGSGSLSTDVLAASGGVGFSASGNGASVTDSQNVSATVGAGASFSQTGGFNLKALHKPKLSAEVEGVGIAGGLQAGVSVAVANFTGDTTASVAGTGDFGSGAMSVVAQNTGPDGGGYNLDSYALAAGGGLLLGANGAVATVYDSSDISSTWTASALPSGSITVEALRSTSQSADGTAYSGGIVGVGAVVSTSTSDGNTTAKISNISQAATGRTADIKINASSGLTSRAEATAGTGGVVAGSAAVAKNVMYGAATASLSANSSAAYLRGNNVTISALQRNDFNGRVDTVNASIVGASGANVENIINTSSLAEVGTGTEVRVNNFTMTARGVGMKEWWDGAGGVNGTANIKSASGGLIDAPSSTSTTDYRQTNTARVGNNAKIAVDYDNGLGGDTSVVRLDVTSDITLHDKVVMNSGGAIPVATGVSKQEVKQDDNAVIFGSGSQVIAPRGVIQAGSRTDTDLDARVSVDTYGLAGAPDGVAWAKYTGGNTLTVDTTALLQASYGNVYLGAGVSSYGTLNKFLINSDVHTWNKTAIPIAGGPDAVSSLTSNNLVLIKNGGVVESGGDVDIVSLSGSDDVNLYFGVNSGSKVTSVGIGKDVYRELAAAVVSAISNAFGGGDVSFDIKKNTITRNTTGAVQIDEGGAVRVGVNRSETLVINEKITSKGTYSQYDDKGNYIGEATQYDVGYTIATRTGGIGTITSTTVEVGAETWKRILWLQQKEVDYAGTTEAGAYAAERKFLEDRLVAQGLATRQSDGTVDFGRGSTGGVSPKALAEAQLAEMQGQKSGVQTTVGVKLAAKTTAETTATDINTLISTATQIAQAQGNVSGDANNLTVLNSTLTTKQTNLTNATTTKTTATNTYNTRVSEQATAQSAYDSCVNTKGCDTATPLANLNTAKSNTASALTAKTNAETSYSTALSERDTAQTAVTNKQTAINGLITTFNSTQNAIVTQEGSGYQNIDIISQVSGITNYTNNITQSTIDTFTGNKTTYNTNVVVPKTTDYNNWNTSYTQMIADISAIQNKIDTGQYSDQAVTGATTNQLIIPNIAIKLGDIRIQANTLQGKGSLSAPGDAQVTITNNSSSQLKINDISISSTGGNVRLNGFLVDNNADVNKINDIDGAATGASFGTLNTRRSGANTAQIKITNTYDPVNETDAAKRRPAPDTYLVGNIFNPEGLVQVKSAAGSIMSTGNIRAGTVDIQANNGDFVQGYQNGFFNVGADPQYRYQSPSITPSLGIVANGAVLLSARYLNINGKVQSGIADWNVTLNSTSGMNATGDATFFGVDANAVLSFRAAYLNNRGSGTVPASGTGSRTTTFTGTGGLTVTYDAETDELYANYAQTAAAISTSNGLYRIKPGGTDNIGYSYDKNNDRFVVDGAAVKGGYIKLYGQIINTEDPNSNGNGGSTPAGLKVMDGFGSINVVNNSGKQVVLGNLDTGSGAAGRIEISDIRSVSSANVPTILNTTYTRDAEGHVLTKQWWGTDSEPGTWSIGAVGRSATYTPQANMRYQYTTGTDESTIREYQRVTRNFFNADSLGVDEWYQGELIRGPFIQNKYDIPGGQRLVLNDSNPNYYSNTSVTLANGTPTMTILRKWSECDPWLCITSRKYTQYRVTTPTKTIYYNQLKADYAIPVAFIGSDSGTINIVSNADLLLQGSLRNINGTTTLDATKNINGGTGGSIKQIADTANITSKSVVLKATGSVGADSGGPIRIYSSADVHHPANGVPNATVSGLANGGDFMVRHYNTNTVLGDITATGKISIQAKGSILASAGGSTLTAQRVELSAAEGSIGSITGNAPINIRVKTTDDPALFTSYGIRASAYSDVNLYSQTWSGNSSGDLLVETISSSTGNVRVKSDGKIIDGNPNESIDTATWNQLVSYWDSVQLRGAASIEKQDLMVASYVANVNRDYQTYWDIRARQASQTGNTSYDASYSYQLSQAEKDAFVASGMTLSQVADYEASKTAEYRAAHARLSTLGSSAGSLTTAYDAGYSYKVVSGTQSSGAGALRITATDANGKKSYDSTEVTGMLKGSSWSDKELGISLTPGLIKEVTNTNVIVKQPNITGNRIELYTNAGVGDRKSPGLAIDLTGDPSLLTNAQKVALATAERSDISISSGGIATVLQNRPLNIRGTNLVSEGLTGGLSSGNIFIASRGSLAVDSVLTSKELRLKVLGDLTNGNTTTPTSPAINANVAILEAATGAVGTTSSPLRVANNGTGASYVVRAEDGVYMTAPTGNLYIDTVYSVGDIALSVPGGAMVAAFSDNGMDIRGKSVTLSAQGNIGSSTAFFDVGVDSDQLITATSTAGGIYLRGTLGAAFNLGNVNAVTDVVIDGFINPVIIKNNIVTTGNISITGGTDIIFKSGTSVTAGVGNIIVEAGDNVLVESNAKVKAGNKASFGGDAITVNGTINSVGGDIRMVADEQDLNFGQGALVQTLGLGRVDAYAQRDLLMNQFSQIITGGTASLNAITGKVAASSVQGGSVDVNAATTITGVGSNQIHLRATDTNGSVRLNRNNDTTAGVVQGTGIGDAAQVLRVSGVNVYGTTKTGDVNVRLERATNVSTIATGSGKVTLLGLDSITAQRIAATGDISLKTNANNLSAMTVATTGGAVTADAAGTLYLSSVKAPAGATFTSGLATTMGTVDTTNGGSRGDLVVTGGQGITATSLIVDDVTLKSTLGALYVTGFDATGDVSATADAGLLTLNAGKARSITGSGQSVTSNSLTSTGAGLTLTASAGSLTFGTLVSAAGLGLSARDRITGSSSGIAQSVNGLIMDANDIAVGNLRSSGANIGLTARTTDVIASASINAATGITANAYRDIVLTSAATTLAAGGGLGLTATTGGITLLGSATSGDTMSLNAKKTLNLGNLTTTGANADMLLTATAGGMNFKLLDAKRHLTATIRDAVTRSTGGVGFKAGGNVTLTAGSTASLNVAAGGMVDITTISGVTIDGNNNTGTVNLVGVSGSSVKIKSAYDILATARIESLAGDIDLESGRNITINEIFSFGKLGLKATQNVTLVKVKYGNGFYATVGGALKVTSVVAPSTGPIVVSAASRSGI